MLYKAQVNGIEVGYAIDGPRDEARPWLVFAHSLACDHSMWDEQAAAFRADYNILRYDLRGHGVSSAPTGEYSLELLADDLRALLDALGIARCHFVGLSLGGMVGQMAALRHPRRFATLTLADTSSRYPPSMKPLWQQRIEGARTAAGMAPMVAPTLERWFTAPYRARGGERLLHIGQLIRRTPVAGYIGCIHAIARLDLTARLAAIRCPVLVLVGADDPGTPPAMAEEIVGAIEGARLTIVPHAAHLSNVEQPEFFNRVLREFLQHHEGA